MAVGLDNEAVVSPSHAQHPLRRIPFLQYAAPATAAAVVVVTAAVVAILIVPPPPCTVQQKLMGLWFGGLGFRV